MDHLIENAGTEPVRLWFGIEWNFAMLAGNSPDHHYRIHGVADADSGFASSGESEEIDRVGLIDRHRGFEAAIELSEPARLWRAPVETVSLSEGGFERIYQSSALVPSWRVELTPGERRVVTTRFEVKPL